MARFETRPYIYRSAVLLKWAIEWRQPNKLPLSEDWEEVSNVVTTRIAPRDPPPHPST
jgi:hypothetical protein